MRGIGKDPQADAMIASAVAQQPDAAYLLVQRALLMEQALATSKAQIASLQSQLQAAQSGASTTPGFLDSNAWGNAASTSVARPSPAPVAAPAYAAPPPSAAQPVAQAAAQPAAPAPSPGFFGGGLGSTLGTVAATAAGVAGGAFLFQGIEHLMNGNGNGGIGHQNAASAPVENTTVNNYYGNESDKDQTRSHDTVSSSNDNASGSDFDSLRDIDLADASDTDGYDDPIV